jgi:hypothetical protein
MLIPYTILEECLVLGSKLVCSGTVQQLSYTINTCVLINMVHYACFL